MPIFLRQQERDWGQPKTTGFNFQIIKKHLLHPHGLLMDLHIRKFRIFA